MNVNWIFIAPSLAAILIFLCPMLINERKKYVLIVSWILILFNNYTIFSMLNSFRRDYGASFQSFPYFNYVLYLVVFNGIFIIYTLVFLMVFTRFKNTNYAKNIQAFFNALRDSIFRIDKTRHRVISLVLIFILFYVIGLVGLFTHEFGHAMMNILYGNYFDRIELSLDLQGLTYIGGSVEYDNIQKAFAYLGGFISESIFASISLVILLFKKEKNKFSWFLSISISMLLLNRLALYFTFPQILNLPSDTLSMVMNLGYDPWILFLIFLPFLMISFEVTFQLISKFYRNKLSEEKDFLSIFITGLLSYILFLIIFGTSNPQYNSILSFY